MPESQRAIAHDFDPDIQSVTRIAAVPTILDVVRRSTGMRFAAVARVTEDRWVACSVLDEIDFGLKPGGELRVETTICNEIRQSREPVVIDNVAEDTEWCKHATPAMYGFQSYISMPIILADGSFFGTLCAIDPGPARLSTPETIGMFRLFAELIGKHLDADRKLAATESALIEERKVSELREEFIAVLGHDLSNPTRAIKCLAELLLKKQLDDDSATMARLVRDSASRMQSLIANVLDLARGRLGHGLTLSRDDTEPLAPVLREVMEELMVSHPDRRVEASFSLDRPINCDRVRIAQLFSNVLGNALSYGAEGKPIHVTASSASGIFELSIANAGEPIPAAARERLFQPFYRNAVIRDREGLGLGLYISHEIAKAHGGTLDVTSSPEETRFTFRMPMDAVRHQCMIYEGSPAKYLPGLASVIVEKLGSNMRCLYLNSPSMIAGIRSYLAAAGVDVVAEVSRGALVLSSDDSHLLNGRFDVDRMLGMLAEALDQALSDGYAGLWAAGDMTWEFGGERDFTKLREYEQGLEALFHQRQELHGICLYHADTLPSQALEEALHSHRASYVNETLSRINPYYVPPGSSTRPSIPAKHLKHVLATSHEGFPP